MARSRLAGTSAITRAPNRSSLWRELLPARPTQRPLSSPTSGDASKKRRGFTLIEVMIALSILAYVMILSSTGLNLAQRVSSRALLDDRESRLLTVSRLLRNALEGPVPVYRRAGSTQWVADFEGLPTSLETVVETPFQAAAPGLYRFRLSLDPTPNGGADLVLRYWPHGASSFSASIKRVLASDIGDATFLYSGGTTYVAQSYSEVGRSWRPDWRNRLTPPRAVRISGLQVSSGSKPFAITIAIGAGV